MRSTVGADDVAADPQLGVMGLQAGCDDGLQAVDDDVEGTQVGCGVRTPGAPLDLKAPPLLRLAAGGRTLRAREPQ